MGKKILVMAGGTGGHVFPALAIVKELQARGHEVEWLGTQGRIEEQVVPANNIKIHYIQMQGIRGNGIKRLIAAPFMVLHAISQAKKVLKEFKPDVVIGFGGYASAPGGVAAFLSGIPLVLHEQNASAGLTNRVLSKFANKILLGVGEAFTGPKVEAVGNPVRAEILKLHSQSRTFGDATGKFRILIIGGSLGAKALNELVPLALNKFTNQEITVVHQCGKGNSEKVAKLYENANFEYHVSDFIDDMAQAYQNADLLICRAGASTVSEVSVAKIPAIFVPLPTAVDDHQTKNALTLVNAQAAILMPQASLTADSLYEQVKTVCKVETLQAMSENAGKQARLSATTKVSDIVESLAK